MRRSRYGFTVIESCAAAAVLAAALTVVVSLLISVVRQREGATCHAQAVILADNLLERLTTESYEAITTERAELVRQAANVDDLLPQGDAAMRVSDVTGPPAGKRIEVEVSWRAGSNGPLSRHQVVTWVYAGADGIVGEAEGTK
jgi:Tfp pilus assembly protein PilV